MKERLPLKEVWSEAQTKCTSPKSIPSGLPLSVMVWEEIHGFSSLGEFRRFEAYIEKQVSDREAEELEPDPEYGKGEIFGGRWFRDVESGQVWRLLEPDFPFKGLWEPVV